MNYLAHALECLDAPYEVAGAAVPDWLGLTRPRLRCRSRHAQPWVEHADPDVAAIARGVVRHHADDDWFHQTPAFGELSIALAREVRRVTGDDDAMRPSFLGHILVELLLDAAILAGEPATLDRYYQALGGVDPTTIAAAIGAMTGADAAPLAGIVARFVELQFLYDYADDARLHYRLNQVMRRVGLPELPPRFVEMLPDARTLVAARRADLLAPLALPA
jgi:hypothetical protein